MAQGRNISFFRGDTFRFNVGFDNISSEPTELAMAIGEKPNSTPIVVASIANGKVVKTSGEHQYNYTVTIEPSDTSGISNLAFMYYYDLQVVVGGDVHTILYGSCKIIPDIMR
jgi:hypothetical protein